jgi:hypothetical protein
MAHVCMELGCEAAHVHAQDAVWVERFERFLAARERRVDADGHAIG